MPNERPLWEVVREGIKATPAFADKEPDDDTIQAVLTWVVLSGGRPIAEHGTF